MSNVSEKHISKHDIFFNICTDLTWFFALSFNSSSVFIGPLASCSRSVLNSDTGVLLSNQFAAAVHRSTANSKTEYIPISLLTLVLKSSWLTSALEE